MSGNNLVIENDGDLFLINDQRFASEENGSRNIALTVNNDNVDELKRILESLDLSNARSFVPNFESREEVQTNRENTIRTFESRNVNFSFDYRLSWGTPYIDVFEPNLETGPPCHGEKYVFPNQDANVLITVNYHTFDVCGGPVFTDIKTLGTITNKTGNEFTLQEVTGSIFAVESWDTEREDVFQFPQIIFSITTSKIEDGQIIDIEVTQEDLDELERLVQSSEINQTSFFKDSFLEENAN